MNYSALKILPGNDDDLHKTRNKYITTDAFTVLPPFSPQIPGPPPTPNPYRILPPIALRKKPSFVILQEVGSRSTSRDPSPSGRVSPFRGCGFKPTSREQSPSRQLPEEKSCDPTHHHHQHRSRRQLPVTLHQKNTRRMSKSVSPVSHSNMLRPLNRHISYSPNRLTKILAEMNDNHPINTTSLQQKVQTLKGSNNKVPCPNVTPQHNLKKLHTPRVSTQNLCMQKPQIPQNTLKTMVCNAQTLLDSTIPNCQKVQAEQTSKCEQMKKISGKKLTKQIPVSPVRAAKYEPMVKGYENSTVGEKCKPTSAIHTRSTFPKRVSTKSKENVSPSSKRTSPVKMKPANTIQNSSTGIVKIPSKITVKAAKKPSCAKMQDISIKDPILNEVIPPTIAQTSETTAFLVTHPSEEQAETQCDNDLNAVNNKIEKKALTTNNLLNAIKKNMAENIVEEKRELSHTDTSRSLPISISSTGMTESAVTLIRTTTEPALAPVQPKLITEIRSAINEVRNGIEEKQLSKSDEQNLSLSSPTLPNKVETLGNISITEEGVKCTSPVSIQKHLSSPRCSPHLKRVTKILEIEKPSTRCENNEKPSIEEKEEQHGTDQSLGINNHTTTASMETTKNESETLCIKKPSAECSAQQYTNVMAWERFRSQHSKGGRSANSHPVQVSTITQAPAITRATEYSKESRYRTYFCYFCKKCKSRKRNGTMNIVNSNWRNKRFSCGCARRRNGFRGLLNKLRCRDEQNTTILTDAKMDSTSGPPVRNRGGCAFCKSGVNKCMGVLCCWNSVVCLKARKRDDKLYSSFCKRLCCGPKNKTVITESERRRSTISTTRKPRKWTRVFTDFPKLDSSFVEHASVMRGSIPVLPLPLAWICLILNSFLPGFGTFLSGVFCLCTGKARFSINDSLASRFGSFLVNLLVAGSQLFTVLFCLVGWGWSIWWGVIMLRMAKYNTSTDGDSIYGKNKRIMMAEKITNEPRPISMVNQNRDVERGAITA